MEEFSSNLNNTFTSTRGCAEPMFFTQHILPLLPLYNAQWWGYESLTAIVLVVKCVQGICNSPYIPVSDVIHSIIPQLMVRFYFHHEQ